MAKKKVLQIVEAFGGGVFTVLCDLFNGLSDEYEVVVAYSLRPQTPKNFKEYFNKNIKFIEVESFTRSINCKKDIKALKEIRKIVKEEKPDIVHLHSSKAGILGRIGIHNRKIKMFYNPHGFSFLKMDDSRLKRFMYKAIEKVTAMLNHKCTIVGCSKGEYEEAKKLNKNSICINNGINIEKLKEETKSLKEKEIDCDNLKICTVGRIGFQKNPKMFNEIAKNFPNLQFTWIGDGDLKDELTASNIRVTGWLERKDVLKELNDNDIFLLPSLWEGLPISLLEAMYMKKICIVSDVIGNRDVIENGKNGYIAENEDGYANIINKLLKDKNFVELINREWEDIQTIYNMKNMVKKYKEEYGE